MLGKNAEIIFTSGTTDSINLVANTWGDKYLKKGDEILISQLEHHSNIVPWQLIAERKEAKIKVIPITKSGEIDISKVPNLMSSQTKLMAVNYISNSLGTINPIEELMDIARSHQTVTLIDAAQAAPHTKIDVQKLDCDFSGVLWS